MGWERLDKFTADLCASEACNQMGVAAEWRFERGGIGSPYCNDCRSRIDENHIEPSGVRRGDLPGWRNRNKQ